MILSEMRGLGHTFLVLTKRADRMASLLNGAVANLFGPERLNPPEGIAAPTNTWHGVTAEDQQRADERIQHLLRVPGKRFLSVEPMLGPVNLFASVPGVFGSLKHPPYQGNLHAVLLGGESGAAARPMRSTWVRIIKDQCLIAGVPFFFKQWGEWLPFCQREAGQFANSAGKQDNSWAWKVGKKVAGRRLDGLEYSELPWGPR
jgi:protein gp37